MITASELVEWIGRSMRQLWSVRRDRVGELANESGGHTISRPTLGTRRLDNQTVYSTASLAACNRPRSLGRRRKNPATVQPVG